MFSVCEIPFSPWQTTHISAFSLPAATASAACAPVSAERPSARPETAQKTNRLRIVVSIHAEQQEARGCRSKQPRPSNFQCLFTVAVAIDRTCPIVGDEDRTVLGQDDIVRPAQIALIAFDPARGKNILLGVLSVGVDRHAHDAAALIFVPVPGTVFCDQDAVLVLGGKLVAGIELHAERSDMGAEL